MSNNAGNNVTPMIRPLVMSLRRGWLRLTSRRLYLFAMVVVPLAFLWFFVTLMGEGLPLPVPTAVVDMDRSSLSRSVTRALNANQFVEISTTAESFDEAMHMVEDGSIFGFFYIPRHFQRDALAGEQPVLTLYSNMSVFVPGTMSYKGFKTVGVTTKGSLVATTLVSAGATPSEVTPLLQPIAVQDHPLHNPWLSYSVYLDNSFVPGVLALMIMLVTAFSVCSEIKDGTSPQWLADADGSMITALVGKLLPQTVVWTAVGVAMQAVLWRWLHFPLNCPEWTMLAAMFMTVVACQSFALMCCEVCPNLRLSLILTGLTGILSFSVLGFSFPVEQMYGGIAVFSWIMPLRYYFLIYIDQALNGIALYYSRWWFAALAVFPLIPLLGLRRLKRRMLNPVYVP